MKAKTISHILSFIALAMVIGGTIFFIINFVNTKSLLATATTQEQIDEIVRNSTGPFIVYVGLNFFLATMIFVFACLTYAFTEIKKASPMFFTKIGCAMLPMVLLVIYILIWMTLK